MDREGTWLLNYARLMKYVVEHGQLPDKKKQLKAGVIDDTRKRMLEVLSSTRTIHSLFDDDNE